MKVGVTFNCSTDSFFSNGLNYNCLLWYHFLEECGYIPYILTHNSEGKTEELMITKNENRYRCINYDLNNLTNIDSLYLYKELKVIYYCGFYSNLLLNYSKSKKHVYIMMGNEYKVGVQSIIDKTKNSISCLDYDEIWISPQFEFSKDYLEITYKTKVVVCPYVWEPWLIDKYDTKNKTKKLGNTIDVAIMEPNINYGKTCLIPISICEANEELINSVYVFGGKKLAKNKFMMEFMHNRKLSNAKKISFEDRIALPTIVSRCNVVVSCNEDWDLNYVFLECFYLGIPLIHNSTYLKDYGYYYDDLQISQTKDLFNKIKTEFNKEEYIEKHKDVLHKYSIYNRENQKWIKDRNELLFEGECVL